MARWKILESYSGTDFRPRKKKTLLITRKTGTFYFALKKTIFTYFFTGFQDFFKKTIRFGSMSSLQIGKFDGGPRGGGNIP